MKKKGIWENLEVYLILVTMVALLAVTVVELVARLANSGVAAVSKQLQVHHLLLAPGTPVGKADIVRVALCQQGKARLGQLKGPLDPCGTGPGSSHRQAGAIGLVKSIAVGVFLARQQADQCLHQGADTGTHDILPCRGIACMARRLQTWLFC